ncbi:low specificity L-threonine aldolase [Sporolactobacillus sp. THM19-2]|uniref:threonine aldolase family protein n=1 Tax=Sporolactobacillus sp. THM19-2 TaxID=2511171 RepID=UPI00101F5B31|nr:low specificity L-threonine aldolase [Sporolactobacillus sp. THM19-2]RYL92452.1 low specificity L-threonine aldolase [Sporolactobacillus sp. THM19-2]
MYSFKNDYSEGAHPSILEALTATNLEQSEGYGEDVYSQQAISQLKKRLGRDDAAIHFLTGGTQVNLTAISAFLRPHEAAIAAKSGHINVHETGAIEATGHKVVIAPSDDGGKLTPADIRKVLEIHEDEHMVKPKLVYISDTTEVGAIYKKKELEALHDFCTAHHLLLYLDGARLGSALTAKGNDLRLSDLPQLTDAFYIGGTKNGALLGEALVIVNPDLKEDFRYMIKQKGAMLAKGRLIGIQFLELFRDSLYFDLAAHANHMAEKLCNGIEKAGFSFLTQSPSNQIFPIFPNALIDELRKNYAFYIWSKIDEDQSSVRLVTSWATKEEAVDAFLKDVDKYVKDVNQ